MTEHASGQHRVGISLRAADGLVSFLLELFVLTGTAATLAYLLTLTLRVPAVAWYPLSVLCFGALGYYYRTLGGLILPKARLPLHLAAILALGLIAAGVNAVTLNPNEDDFSYLHRAFHAAGHLDAPLSIHHTAHDRADLPAISAVHLLTSLEVATALAAKAVGVPFLKLMHQGIGALALFLMPLAYYRLFRVLRFRPWTAVGGTLGAVLFMALVGGMWGNFTLSRAWQGKCFLVATALPLLAATTISHMLRPRRRTLFELHALTVLGIGLTSTAFFMVPYVVGLLCATVCVMGKMRKRFLIRLLQAASLLISLAVLVALAASPLFLPVPDISVWKQAEKPTYEILAKVIPTWRSALMYALLALYCLVAAVRRTPQRVFSLYALLATLLLVTPGISWVLMKLTTPAVYWRLAYTSLTPALAGMAVAHSLQKSPLRPVALVACLGVFGFLLAAGPYTLEKRYLAPLHGEKFTAASIAETDALAARLPEDAVVIAPQDIVWVLGLRSPDMRFIVTRRLETPHVFKNAGDPEETGRRIALGLYLEKGERKDDPGPLLAPYLSKADALVLPIGYPKEPAEQALQQDQAQWEYEVLEGRWHFWRRVRAEN